MSTLETVQSRLIAAGVATGAGTGSWPCFVGFVPDLPAQAIGIQFTGGYPQDTHGGENLLQTFQVMVRAGEQAFALCEPKWLAMFRALQDADLSASGISLIQAMATGPMQFNDAKNRICMTANFRIVRSNS